MSGIAASRIKRSGTGSWPGVCPTATTAAAGAVPGRPARHQMITGRVTRFRPRGPPENAGHEASHRKSWADAHIGPAQRSLRNDRDDDASNLTVPRQPPLLAAVIRTRSVRKYLPARVCSGAPFSGRPSSSAAL